jgi:hypothetical protein
MMMMTHSPAPLAPVLHDYLAEVGFATEAEALAYGAAMVAKGMGFDTWLADGTVWVGLTVPEATGVCDECKATVPADDLDTGEVQVSRQTHWSPAEYETRTWCFSCRTRPDDDGAPDNRADY